MWSFLILITTRKAEFFFTFLPKNEVIWIALKVKANRQEEHLSGRNEPFSTVMGRSSSLRSVRRGTECPRVHSSALRVSLIHGYYIVSVKGKLVCNICNWFSTTTLFGKWLKMGLYFVT